MNLEETAKLIASIGKIWPSFAEHRDLDGTIALWQRVFADDDAALVGKALGAFFATDTRGFAPVPGQLKEILAQMRQADGDGELSEQEAWRLVSKACSRSAYDSESEFAKLPPVCQQVVGDPGALKAWALMDADEVETVVASNFMRSYRARADQAREWSKLPASMRAFFPALRTIGALPEERQAALPPPVEVDSIPVPEDARAEILRALGRCPA